VTRGLHVAVSDVGVVVVSHNSRADLERSLPVVRSAVRQVTVVDNASLDGTATFVRGRFPDVHLLELRENVGYGAACNLGIASISTPFVMLLNPDAWPIGNSMERLASCAEREPRLGAIGPLLEAPNGARQQSLIRFPTPWWLGRPAITSARSRARTPVLPWSRPMRRFLVGAALLVRREAVEQVGGFDPSFFMFYEEVDLCWRLQEAGWRVELCPDARFVHIGGTSTRRNWEAMYREQVRGHLRFLAKHHGVARAETARKFLTAVMAMRSVGYAIARRSEERRISREAAAWLRSGDTLSLLEFRPPAATVRSETT
jgi:N-acetylglucosaminyl-diphospho-decaprenol L-rhamnosyltransferase